MPNALKNMWILNRERNPDNLYRLRNENEIFIFKSRLSHFENFPLYCIPSLWLSFNNENVKIQRNKIQFNNLLKKHLLDELNESYTCSRLLCPQCHLNLNYSNLPTNNLYIPKKPIFMYRSPFPPVSLSIVLC